MKDRKELAAIQEVQPLFCLLLPSAKCYEQLRCGINGSLPSYSCLTLDGSKILL